MSVDKNSIEYMFGEIMSLQAQFSEEQQQFRETMGEVTTRLDTLPCARHADDLKRLPIRLPTRKTKQTSHAYDAVKDGKPELLRSP